MANSITKALNSVDTKQSFSTIDKVAGYRSREDKTQLPPNTLIYPSQNVIMDITGRLKNRPGMELYGAANSTITPLYGCYTWEEHKGGIINFRAYSGNLQFDYNGTWTTIKTSIGSTSGKIRYTNYWDNTELENTVLFVDGSTNVYKWNGATATYASATTNTLTKQGSDTWAQAGFYASSNRKVWLAGVEYTYTGGEGTTTLTGVTPDPTDGTQAVGDLIYQEVVTTSSITSVTSGFKFDGISNSDNQIYYASQASNNVYVSVYNNYTTCAFTSPVRIVGEGALVSLRALWTGFVIQEDTMYISAGLSQWYQVTKKLSSDNAKETFEIKPLKVSAKQGPISQEGITKDRDSVVMLTNETRLVTLGRTLNVFGTPMMTDYSYPIALDFNMYDFTDASLKFWKSYILVAIPQESKWYIFNQTNPQNMFWEAPQTGAFAGFMEDDSGNLYAHSYNTPETFLLFTGGTDNGAPILSIAKFAYVSFGGRSVSDYFNEYWVEGYISPNTVLQVSYNLDLDGCSTTLTGDLVGSDNRVVCLLKSDASLGKTSLGKHGLGTEIQVSNPDVVPPYFNAILVSPRKDFYKFSPQFVTYGKDYSWQLLSFGPLVTQSMYGSNSIKINLS